MSNFAHNRATKTAQEDLRVLGAFEDSGNFGVVTSATCDELERDILRGLNTRYAVQAVADADLFVRLPGVDRGHAGALARRSASTARRARSIKGSVLTVASSTFCMKRS